MTRRLQMFRSGKSLIAAAAMRLWSSFRTSANAATFTIIPVAGVGNPNPVAAISLRSWLVTVLPTLGISRSPLSAMATCCSDELSAPSTRHETGNARSTRCATSLWDYQCTRSTSFPLILRGINRTVWSIRFNDPELRAFFVL